MQFRTWGSAYYLPAVLATPIAKETGWSITSVVGGLSWGLLVAGLSSPAVGRQIDRHGGRSVLAVSSLLLALGMLLDGASGQRCHLLPRMDPDRRCHGGGFIRRSLLHFGTTFRRGGSNVNYRTDPVRWVRQHHRLAGDSGTGELDRLEERLLRHRRSSLANRIPYSCPVDSWKHKATASPRNNLITQCI